MSRAFNRPLHVSRYLDIVKKFLTTSTSPISDNMNEHVQNRLYEIEMGSSL
jgi:hypothetical protein